MKLNPFYGVCPGCVSSFLEPPDGAMPWQTERVPQPLFERELFMGIFMGIQEFKFRQVVCHALMGLTLALPAGLVSLRAMAEDAASGAGSGAVREAGESEEHISESGRKHRQRRRHGGDDRARGAGERRGREDHASDDRGRGRGRDRDRDRDRDRGREERDRDDHAPGGDSSHGGGHSGGGHS